MEKKRKLYRRDDMRNIYKYMRIIFNFNRRKMHKTAYKMTYFPHTSKPYNGRKRLRN